MPRELLELDRATVMGMRDVQGVRSLGMARGLCAGRRERERRRDRKRAYLSDPCRVCDSYTGTVAGTAPDRTAQDR